MKPESVASMTGLGSVDDLVVSGICQGEFAHSRHEKGSLSSAEMTVAGEIVSRESSDGEELARSDRPQFSRRAAGAIYKLDAFVRARVNAAGNE